MSKNQLFKIQPDYDILEKLLDAFCLTSLNDTRFFTKENVANNNTSQKITDLIPELKKYYLPCKAKIYLVNLNEKKCITLLRQFIKIYQYKCIAIEKSFNGKKQMTYRLIKFDKAQLDIGAKKKKKFILNFDT